MSEIFIDGKLTTVKAEEIAKEVAKEVAVCDDSSSVVLKPEDKEQYTDPDQNSKTVMKTMMSLGEYFAQQAEAAPSLKQSAIAFEMAEKAFKMACEAGKSVPTSALPLELNLLLSVTAKIPKTQLWQRYIDVCISANIHPIGKRSFYNLAQNLGFTERKVKGAWYFIPPEEFLELSVEAGVKYVRSLR